MLFAFKDSRFGNPMLVWPQAHIYHNCNIAIQLFSQDPENGFVEPWATASVNPGIVIPQDQVALKTWVENDGLVPLLIEANIVEDFILEKIQTCFGITQVHRLTKDFYRTLVLPMLLENPKC